MAVRALTRGAHRFLPNSPQVFFVISGFVVTGSLLRGKRAASPLTFLGSFYARRIKRLMPALIVAVLVTAVLLSVMLPPWTPTLGSYYTSGLFSLVGFANVHFANLPTGYFDEGASSLQFNPFTHCWSLGVEEQFYLCFPLLLLCLFGKRVLRHPCSPMPCQTGSDCRLGAIGNTRLPVCILLVLQLASMATCWAMTASFDFHSKAYYLLPSRWWQVCVPTHLLRAHTPWLHLCAMPT